MAAPVWRGVGSNRLLAVLLAAPVALVSSNLVETVSEIVEQIAATEARGTAADVEPKPKPDDVAARGQGMWLYDEKVAKAFAAMTQAAYCDKARDRQYLQTFWDCPECKDAGFEILPKSVRFVSRAEIWEENSTFVVLGRLQPVANAPATAVSDAGCFISTRGTETFTNWIRDLQSWHTEVSFDWCDGCLVEDGFHTVMVNVLPEIIATLRKMGCIPAAGKGRAGSRAAALAAAPLAGPLMAEYSEAPSSSLYVTGHSLGAAVATLLMAEFNDAGYDVRLSHTFESPRVGNKAFAEAFQKEFNHRAPAWRVTYHMDPVVHLPLAMFGFTHVNYEVFYEPSGKYTICNETEDAHCSDQYATSTLFHSGDHCHVPLATKGSLC